MSRSQAQVSYPTRKRRPAAVASAAGTQSWAEAEPVAVFVSKGRLGDPRSPAVQRKKAIHDRHLRSIWIKVGPVVVERMGKSLHISLPALRPRLLGGFFFYTVGPFLAVGAALRRGPRGIVCQGPYEGFGVILLTRALPRSRRPPVQIDVHFDWRTASRLYGSRARMIVSPVADRAAKWALRRATRIHAVSDWLATEVRDTGYTGPIDLHIDFSDYSTFLEKPPLPLPVEGRIVFVGVLERYKAIDVLVSAWPLVLSRVPTAQLVIVGRGALARGLRRTVEAGGLNGSVQFIDHLEQAKLSDLFDQSWCVVLPSRSEGLGRVVLEAMARGRPVVASSAGALGEVVEDGETGYLVPPERLEPLADALVKILRDPDTTQRMGAEGHRRVIARDPTAEYESGMQRLAEWILSGPQ